MATKKITPQNPYEIVDYSEILKSCATPQFESGALFTKLKTDLVELVNNPWSKREDFLMLSENYQKIIEAGQISLPDIAASLKTEQQNNSQLKESPKIKAFYDFAAKAYPHDRITQRDLAFLLDQSDKYHNMAMAFFAKTEFYHVLGSAIHLKNTLNFYEKEKYLRVLNNYPLSNSEPGYLSKVKNQGRKVDRAYEGLDFFKAQQLLYPLALKAHNLHHSNNADQKKNNGTVSMDDMIALAKPAIEADLFDYDFYKAMILRSSNSERISTLSESDHQKSANLLKATLLNTQSKSSLNFMQNNFSCALLVMEKKEDREKFYTQDMLDFKDLLFAVSEPVNSGHHHNNSVASGQAPSSSSSLSSLSLSQLFSHIQAKYSDINSYPSLQFDNHSLTFKLGHFLNDLTLTNRFLNRTVYEMLNDLTPERQENSISGVALFCFFLSASKSAQINSYDSFQLDDHASLAPWMLEKIRKSDPDSLCQLILQISKTRNETSREDTSYAVEKSMNFLQFLKIDFDRVSPVTWAQIFQADSGLLQSFSKYKHHAWSDSNCMDRILSDGGYRYSRLDLLKTVPAHCLAKTNSNKLLNIICEHRLDVFSEPDFDKNFVNATYLPHFFFSIPLDTLSALIERNKTQFENYDLAVKIFENYQPGYDKLAVGKEPYKNLLKQEEVRFAYHSALIRHNRYSQVRPSFWVEPEPLSRFFARYPTLVHQKDLQTYLSVNLWKSQKFTRTMLKINTDSGFDVTIPPFIKSFLSKSGVQPHEYSEFMDAIFEKSNLLMSLNYQPDVLNKGRAVINVYHSGLDSTDDLQYKKAPLSKTKSASIDQIKQIDQINQNSALSPSNALPDNFENAQTQPKKRNNRI